MNERIKDMLEQPVFDRLRDWYNIGPVQRATLEEFAELIIKECTKELEISKKCDIYTGELCDSEWNDCVDYQIKMLKEHFGVTE